MVGGRQSSTYQRRRDARVSHQEAPVWRAGDPYASWRSSHAIVAAAAVELWVVAVVDIAVVAAAAVSGITNALKVAEASAVELEVQLRSGEGRGRGAGAVRSRKRGIRYLWFPQGRVASRWPAGISCSVSRRHDTLFPHKTHTHARTHTHTRTGARRVDAKVGLAGRGRVDFLVHRARASGIGSPRPGGSSARAQQSSSRRRQPRRAGAGLCRCLRKGRRRAGWTAEVLTQPGEHRAEAASGCGLGKAFQAMATLVNS